MPPLFTKPRHAAPLVHNRARAAMVPAVLLASTGSALGGLALTPAASAQEPAQLAFTAAATVPLIQSAEDLAAEREVLQEQRVSRDRDRRAAEAAAAQAAAEAAAAEAAAVAQAAAEAAAAEAAAAVEAAEAAAEQAAVEAADSFARPGEGRMTSSFGNRWGRLHAGVDLAAGTGSPIRAAAAGTVLSARNEGGYGKAVRIQHSDGTVTVYAHLSAFSVGGGEKVAPGEQVGREGNTGNSTGPHLHFEVRVGGEPVNPINWLRNRGVKL